MLGIVAAALGVEAGAGASWLTLIGPRGLHGSLAVTRNSTAGGYDAAGNYLELAANQPRFDTAGGLIVEEARSNAIRNPRIEGAVAGSPGTVPAYWTVTAIAGLTRTLSVGTEAGAPYLDCNFSGTSTAAGYCVIMPEQVGAVAAAAGQNWTCAVNVALVAGSIPGGGNLRLRVQERGDSTSPATDVSIAATAGTQRVACTRLLTAGGTTSIVPSVLAYVPSGVGMDFTLRVSLPQMEQAGFATTPVLPPAGSRAAQARAADQVLRQPAGGYGSAGTVLVAASIPQASPAGVPQGLWQIDDGTDANRLILRNTGTALTAEIERGGASGAVMTLGGIAPGTAFRAGFAWAPGSQSACMAGGSVQTAAATLPAGLARLLPGHGSGSWNRALNGSVRLLQYLPARLPDTQLQGLVNQS
ncbi:hypothetical protein MVG78_15780 [Roseomonas gilardii subsp. gilardii]|uniref:hypothetical protein n=1 Tax=Roseomonas gilardii TaxID=257708 RepID=UPI001FF9D090|nr:hypothetical protein [Roseomonas gilardii]UPG71978.1 hypothetical protein MVG78_15780 [Roseomonas gilardii subsp. gilardii]